MTAIEQAVEASVRTTQALVDYALSGEYDPEKYERIKAEAEQVRIAGWNAIFTEMERLGI